MQLRYFVRNCEAQTGSLFDHALSAIKALGNLATLFLGHAGSVIVYLDKAHCCTPAICSRVASSVPTGRERRPQRKVTLPPRGVYLMAFSTRLETSSRNNQLWPQTDAGSTSRPKSRLLDRRAIDKGLEHALAQFLEIHLLQRLHSALRASARDRASN